MTDDQQAAQATLADDLLNGAGEIGKFLGKKKREIYHLHKTKRLPIGKLGKNLIASKRQLTRAARALTS